MPAASPRRSGIVLASYLFLAGVLAVYSFHLNPPAQATFGLALVLLGLPWSGVGLLTGLVTSSDTMLAVLLGSYLLNTLLAGVILWRRVGSVGPHRDQAT